ncbi:hypothetical protein PAPHI01_1867 [Pancytospora philotis]|nr:hypothetical protein PAPHI01_1867 [Pancytospora philotis]
MPSGAIAKLERAGSQQEIIKRLCLIVSGQDSGEERARPKLSSDEALGLLADLLAGHSLAEEVKRIEVGRRRALFARHLRYARYFEVFGHNGMIDRLCFDNSSTYAFSGSADGVIKVWNVEQGMLVTSLYGHASSINDLSVSLSGEYLVSGDYNGIVCVWCLREFAMVQHYRMEEEVIFCEFYDAGTQDAAEEALSFACITSSGTVKMISFTREATKDIKVNNFLEGESIKAICVTDGGRFIVCGGWWPFTVIYDTHDISKILVLEDFRARSLCAAKNGLKLALAALDRLCIYTFYAEGDASQANFKKRSKAEGCWHKSVHSLDSTTAVERMCFLSSFLLVTACADNQLRIYDDDLLVATVPSEIGTIHAHPTKNIFAVVGQSLSMLEIRQEPAGCEDSETSFCYDPSLPAVIAVPVNSRICVNASCISEVRAEQPRRARRSGGAFIINKFFDEPLPICVHDGQFSADGRFFITGDNQGVLRVYSIFDPISVPAQQFFRKDFVAREDSPATADSPDAEGDREPAVQGVPNADGTPEWMLSAEQYEETVDVDGNVNADWKKLDYRRSRGQPSVSVRVEGCAAEYLQRDKMDYQKFSRRYLVKEEESDSSDDKTWTSMDESISSTEEELSTTDETSDSEAVSLDPRLVVSDSEDRPQMLRRMIVKEEPSNERVHLRRNLVRQENRQNAERVLRRSLGERGAASEGEAITSSASSDSSDVIITHRTRKLVEESDAEERRKKVRPRSPRAASRRSERKIVKESSEEQTVESSESTPRNTQAAAAEPPVPRRALRRQIVDSASDEHEEEAASGRRRLRSSRKIVESEETGIDAAFEASLSRFSIEWLRDFGVYRGDSVYFDSEAYQIFTGLEGRLGYSESPEAGIYTVENVELRFIGSIPYLVVQIGKVEVAFYEYPDGTGIMCLEAQLTQSGTVSFLTFDGSKSGSIAEANGLLIRIKDTWILRSQLIVAGVELGIEPIESDRHHKLLHGCDRRAGSSVFDVINYNIINRRLALGLYRSDAQLLADLDSIRKAAPREHAKYADKLYSTIRRQLR